MYIYIYVYSFCFILFNECQVPFKSHLPSAIYKINHLRLLRFYPLILFFLYSIMRAAEVTENASRVAPLVNSWQFDHDDGSLTGWMDPGRQYAVQYINQSRAGGLGWHVQMVFLGGWGLSCIRPRLLYILIYLFVYLFIYLCDWLIDWFIWLIDWLLVGWLIDWLIDFRCCFTFWFLVCPSRVSRCCSPLARWGSLDFKKVQLLLLHLLLLFLFLFPLSARCDCGHERRGKLRMQLGTDPNTCPRGCQKECQNICPKYCIFPDDVSETMSE